MGGLKRKLGPLPLWAWLAIGAVLGYVLYRRASGRSGSSGQAQETQTVFAQTPDSSMGNVPQAGSPADTGQSSSDLVSALGGQQASLFSALEAVNQDVLGLAQSQIAAAQTQSTFGSFNQNTQPVAGVEPNSNAPQVIYVQPQVMSSPAPSPPATQTPPRKTAVTTPTKYYTYKRDVPLRAGQTVHFTSGRGYYAA